MSNTVLFSALRSLLVSAIDIVDAISGDQNAYSNGGQPEDYGAIGTKVPEALAVVAAIPAAESSPTITGCCAGSADKPEVAPQADYIKGSYGQVINLLDGKYGLRKVSTLEEKTGLSQDEIEDLLNDNGVDFVIRHKRGTGEPLIGLASRN